MEQKQKYNQFKGQSRLPKFVVPKRYDIKLKPDLAACKFAGTVDISVDVVADTKFVVLNASELTVDFNSVRFGSHDGSKVLEAKEVELFDEDEIMVVEFAESLPSGAGSLYIAFDGTLNDKMKGFYRRVRCDCFWPKGLAEPNVREIMLSVPMNIMGRRRIWR